MNKTFNINLAGFIFHIDEKAYHRLERYLDALKRQFSRTEGGNEIISDVESRIAELFKERTSDSKEVITEEDVEEVMKTMGRPEDYLDPEDTAQAPPPPEEEYYSGSKRIYRDPDNRIIGGVSSGLAAYFNTDPLWLRLLFVLLFFAGPGIIVYIIMWAVIPKARTTAEKLRMRGENVNVSNIERSIREEMEGVSESAKRFSRKARDYDYRRSTNQLGRFFGDLGRFIVDALGLIFRFLLKLIGFFLLLIGFVILFAIVVSLFAGTVEIMDSAYGVDHFFEFMKLVTTSSGHYNLLMAAIVLTVIAPLFLLIYLGIRILFDLDPLNRPTKAGLSLTTFIGLILLIVAGVRIGLEFDDDAATSNEIALGDHRTFHVTAVQDSIYDHYDENYDARWRHYENANAFNLVQFDILKAEGDEPYLEVRFESHGSDRREARENAEKLQYEVEIKDSVIALPVYYLLRDGENFHGQEVELILYLPEGHAAFIDPSIRDYLYDVDNIQNMWDGDMADRLWIMTEQGLTCEGCDIPESVIEEEEEDSLEIQNENGDDEVDVKINEDGIRIEYNTKKDSGKIQLSNADPINQQAGDSLRIFCNRYSITI